jgi:hypothetical protein
MCGLDSSGPLWVQWQELMDAMMNLWGIYSRAKHLLAFLEGLCST